MGVMAVYELPVPIWVTCDALDATYPSGYGELRFDVAMPTDQPPFGGPPSGLGINPDSELVGAQTVWAQEYGAHIPDSLRPATALHRVAVTDVEGPSYEHKPWFTAEYQLAEYISTWFNQVRTWAEVVSGQDLDPNHRVFDAEFVGVGLTFIDPAHADALGVKATTSSVLPLRAQEWAAILQFVCDGREAPLEEVLSRDARGAHRRGSNRRAIIDAATALELALGRHVRRHADQLPDRQRDRLNDRTALGGYISIVENSGLQLAVPVDRLRLLNDLRNNAAHHGAAPGYLEAGTAVRIMIDFLSTYGELPRTSSREPDGGELVLAGEGDGVG